MGELTHLAEELAANETVTEVETTQDDMVVSFDSHRGAYDSLSSEVVSIIGRYDCCLYSPGLNGYKYTVTSQ